MRSVKSHRLIPLPLPGLWPSLILAVARRICRGSLSLCSRRKVPSPPTSPTRVRLTGFTRFFCPPRRQAERCVFASRVPIGVHVSHRPPFIPDLRTLSRGLSLFSSPEGSPVSLVWHFYFSLSPPTSLLSPFPISCPFFYGPSVDRVAVREALVFRHDP